MITKRSSLKKDLEYYSTLVDSTYKQLLDGKPENQTVYEYYARSVLTLYQNANPVANAIVDKEIEKNESRKKKSDIIGLKTVMQERLEIMSKLLHYILTAEKNQEELQD
ncbi:MAG: hypothetical protein ABW007_03070 [Chitinophagaceae bacterium]